MGIPRFISRFVAVLAASLAALACSGLTAAASASSLNYYGGPVVHSVNLVLVEWGPGVRSTYTNTTTGDPGFFRYLAAHNGSTSDIGGVLAQYMDSTGQNSQNHFAYGGTYQISPSVGATRPGTVMDSGIQSELAADIGSGSLPTPAGNGMSTIYVVLFPPGDNVCFDGGGGCAYDATGGFCAYHGSGQLSSSTHVLYAAMVDNGPNTNNYGGCGSSSSDVANQTAVVSHEVGEAINDPLVGEAPNWGPPLGWYDPTFNGEIADKCDPQLATNGSWTVEPLWSNVDNSCMAAESAFRAPTASFLGPGSAPAGQLVSFNASSSSDPTSNHDSALEQDNGRSYSIASGITSYRWSWGDGNSSTSASSTVSHTFAAPGTYQVSLTVTDRLGFTSTDTQSVSVTSAGGTAPVPVTDQATGIDGQGATLTGTLNPEGQSVSYQFLYGTSASSLTQSTPSTAGPSGQTPVAVSATVSGLSPSTTYYYELVATSGGQTISGGVQSFTTGTGASLNQTPVAATGPASRVGPSGALLTGTVNPGGPAAVQYRYSYGTAAGALTQTTTATSQAGGNTAASVSATVSGLRARTRYYYSIDVLLGGQTFSGAVRSFTTPAPLPGVSTGRASSITSSSAVISGAVNPHGFATLYQVQFGPTAAYGFSTTWIAAGSEAAQHQISLVLTGLRARSTYHYRLVAQGVSGTVVGADHTFSTMHPWYAPRFRFTTRRVVSHRLLLRRPLRVHFRCSRACTAHFLLTAARAGLTRVGAVPLAVGRTASVLQRAGRGVARVRLSRRARARVNRSGRGLKLILMGYAVAAGNAASTPQSVRIRLT